jgi:signal transduction histidine kinase
LRRGRSFNLNIDTNNSSNGDVIVMPPVLQDVLCDLVANARKYTTPGGRIYAGLADDGSSLHLVVEDTGCGIPEDEIRGVVKWGVRGSNVLHIKSNGGGFGLTKAYIATRDMEGVCG